VAKAEGSRMATQPVLAYARGRINGRSFAPPEKRLRSDTVSQERQPSLLHKIPTLSRKT